RRHARLLLLDHPDNLRLGKTALSHSSAPSRLGRLYIMMRDFAGGRSVPAIIDGTFMKAVKAMPA
ncbi:hypothetical protein AB9K34_11750, partial [Sedimentitalea sp. XS_ASV28]|uniref:hypothetical protein n=1 Tax=Sedimentitalea sp. XS_ASV28 TaxID=3241296 RepID=UPI0035116EF1